MQERQQEQEQEQDKEQGQEVLDIGEQEELVFDEAARPFTVVYQVGTQG